MSSSHLRIGIRVLFIIVIECSCSSRKSDKRNDLTINISKDSIANLDGKQLSHLYCSMCHKYPDAFLLPKKLWASGVLPNMGRRLGIKTSFNPYLGFSMSDALIMREANIYPDKPIIPETAWNKIVDYYQKAAPDSLQPIIYPQKIDDHLEDFKVHTVKGSIRNASLINYVGFNPFNQMIYAGDYNDSLKMIDKKGDQLNSFKFPSPVTDVNYLDKNLSLVTCVGILYPNEQSKGRIYEYNNKADTLLLIGGLQRPVHTEVADLNGDGKKDLIVCEYGNQTGKLTWFENLGDNRYKKHLLYDGPGAIKTQTYDFNHDGLPDIMALFGQGNERIMIFYNKGGGDFDETTPLKFYSVNGSLYFELVDFNGDGYQDILYCSGDNADQTNTLKPYHGIYIYLNDGKNNFTQSYFFPMYGCIKAMAYDYDHDGDLDIAAISYFPDFNRKPILGFMYLKNISTQYTRFQLSTFPENQEGRWLVMDRADYDHDGDMDLIMGSFLFSVSPVPQKQMQTMVKSGVRLMILENTTNNSTPPISARKPDQ